MLGSRIMGKAAAFTFEDAVAEMARAELGHKRRTARLADSARRISQHPGGSLPEKFKDPTEGVAQSRERDSRESLLWVKAVKAIGPAPQGRHWVDVCDRAADTFEFLEYEISNGRHCVVRSTYSRALEVESDEQPRLLHDLLRSLPAQMGWQVEVSATKGQARRT